MKFLNKKKENNEFANKPKKKKKSRKRLIVISIVLLAVIAGGYYLFLEANKQQTVLSGAYTIAKAERRDITDSLSGTGALQPADSYMVRTLTSGDILKADFEEGDVVAKDTVLYEIDSSNVSKNIENAEISLSESKRFYERRLEALKDLSIRAGEGGTIISLDVEVGDLVQKGQTIAVVRNHSVMSLSLPFGANDAAQFAVGQKAYVTLEGSFETLEGTIAKISSVDEILSEGMLVRKVTIDVPNPGGIKTGHLATAAVDGVDSTSSGVFTYKAEYNVFAEASGEVASVQFSEGDTVSKDQVVAVLDSTNLKDEIENAKNNLRKTEIALDSQYDTLDGYTIESPIGGTVIEKHYKEGDTAEAGQTLCTIFDLTYLKMTLNVDELDVSKVKVGQKVIISAESVKDKKYDAIVTKVNINGMTAGGTTTYPVTIQINETDGLLPGMNVDAEIIIEQLENVLVIPSTGVTRGNKVLVPTTEQTTEPGVPAGYKYVEVKTGVADKEYIEIISGLSENDEIAIENRKAATFMEMMNGGRMNRNGEFRDRQSDPSSGGGDTSGGGNMP